MSWAWQHREGPTIIWLHTPLGQMEKKAEAAPNGEGQEAAAEAPRRSGARGSACSSAAMGCWNNLKLRCVKKLESTSTCRLIVEWQWVQRISCREGMLMPKELGSVWRSVCVAAATACEAWRTPRASGILGTSRQSLGRSYHGEHHAHVLRGVVLVDCASCRSTCARS